ncbi:MAG: Ig-like domain-containing protein [Lachnospiraceae bacterium]|nr:Ig-like domain-containing protein [Lachnospiraceae bacterium]
MNKKSLKAAIVTLVAAIGFTGAVATPSAAKKAPKKITVNRVNAVAVKVKGKTKLKVTAVKPAKANKKVTYKTMNPKIATVNKKGVVVGKSVGQTTIVATSTVNTKKRQAINIKVVNAKQAAKKSNFVKASKNVTASPSAVVKLKVKYNPKAAAKVKIGKIKANNKKLVEVKNKKVLKVLAPKILAKKGIVIVRVKTTTVEKASKVFYYNLFGKKSSTKVTVSSATPASATTASSVVKPIQVGVKVGTHGAVVDLYATKDLFPNATNAAVSTKSAIKVTTKSPTGQALELIMNKSAMTQLTSSANTVSPAAIFKKFVNADNDTKYNCGNVKLVFSNAVKGQSRKTVTISGAGNALDGTYDVLGTQIDSVTFRLDFLGNKIPYFNYAPYIIVQTTTVNKEVTVVVSSENKTGFTFSADKFGFNTGAVVTKIS